MIQPDDFSFTACPVPLLANRTAHPFNTATQINNQMIPRRNCPLANPEAIAAVGPKINDAPQIIPNP